MAKKSYADQEGARCNGYNYPEGAGPGNERNGTEGSPGWPAAAGPRYVAGEEDGVDRWAACGGWQDHRGGSEGAPVGTRGATCIRAKRHLRGVVRVPECVHLRDI